MYSKILNIRYNKNMPYGMILNSATCLLITISAFSAFWIIRSKREAEKTTAFMFFWFFVALQWLFSAIRTYFAFCEIYAYDVFFYKLVEITVGIYMIFFFFFIISKVFKNIKLIKTLTIVFSTGIAVYLYFLMTKEIILLSQSYFATEYRLNDISLFMFRFLFSALLIFLIFEIGKELLRKIRQHTPIKKNMLILSSILFYSVFGYFDQVGEPSGWKLIIIRAILAGTALLAFMAHTDDHADSKENPKKEKEFVV